MRTFFRRKRYASANRAAVRLVLFSCAFALIPASVSAAAAISEVMYDVPGTDTGREWIEVQNTGASAIDLSAWKLFEANTNHKISAVGAATVSAGGFAVVADDPDKFRIDNPGFAGLLFDSSFSLSNTGETLVLHDDTGATADSVTYDPSIGAGGDGNSLQKTASGSWIAAAPTPGSATTATRSIPAANPGASSGGSNIQTASTTVQTESSTSGGGSSADQSSISTHSSQEAVSASYGAPDFQISAGRPRVGFVGAPLEFEAKVVKSADIPVGSNIRAVWSLGDGTQLTGQSIAHAYAYPGDYIVVANGDYGSAHAVARVDVRIEAPVLSLSLLFNGVEVSNRAKDEVNLGGFILEDSRTRFIFPQDTIVPPLSSITLSFASIGMDRARGFVRVANPAGNVLNQISVSADSAAERQASSSEPLIALPQGLTAEDLKTRLMQALEIGG